VPTRLAVLAAEEVKLAAACSALAERLGDPRGELTALVDEHLASAARLAPEGVQVERRVLEATVRSLFLAATRLVRGEAGLYGWLREREHRLVRSYMALEETDALDDDGLRALRRVLLPSAFARFARADRLASAAEAREAAT
jgi:hypothetical protein